MAPSASIQATGTARPGSDVAKCDAVVLLHGLGPGKLIMQPLARRLTRAGYRTVNWSYPSFRHTISEHARRLHPLLVSLDADPTVRKIHLVTYSMGSIIARCALALGSPARLGRMVMIAPPNRGSRWAALVGPYLRRCIRIVDELAARPGSFVNSLPHPEQVEFGVIAARYDLLVGCTNTHLPGQRDHIVLPGLHSTIVLQRRAADAVLQFLSTGHFTPDASAAACDAQSSP